MKIGTARALGLLALSAASLPNAVCAADMVTTQSAVFLERSTGANQRSLERAERLRPGDRVITILTWRRNAPGGGFTLINPLPRPLSYQGSADSGETVSIDGGRTWGKLGSLRIGDRLATPEDVTHVRWRVTSSSPSGRIAYSAIVR